MPIAQSASSSVVVSGYTDENSSVTVYVNGEKAVVNMNDNGNFSARIQLAKGINNVSIVALNKWGYSSSSSLSINYTGS